MERVLELCVPAAKPGKPPATKRVPVCPDLPPEVDAAEPHAVVVLLSHGAGSAGLHSGSLPALSASLASSGVPCLRYHAPGGNLESRERLAVALLAACVPRQELSRAATSGHIRLAALVTGWRHVRARGLVDWLEGDDLQLQRSGDARLVHTREQLALLASLAAAVGGGGAVRRRVGVH